MRKAVSALVLCLGCAERAPAEEPRDAMIADARSATRSDAGWFDAARYDLDCFSPLLLAPSTDLPRGSGCACDPAIQRDAYCLGLADYLATYALTCHEGRWLAAAAGHCVHGYEDRPASCAQRGFEERPDAGCRDGYAPVPGSLRLDGGMVGRDCCNRIVVSETECRRSNMLPAPLRTARDGRPECTQDLVLLGFIADAPLGCCAFRI